MQAKRVKARFPFRPQKTGPPPDVPDIQACLAAHAKAYKHAERSLKLAEAEKWEESKREEAKAKRWLKEFVRLGGKVSAR